MSFSSLSLSSPLLQAIADQGYSQPTPIQQQAIPAVLAGRDLLAAAQTGTGKTAAFALPLLHLISQQERPKANQVRALVLTPTRELALQVWQDFVDYGQKLNLRLQVVYGGVKVNPQMQRLLPGCDILVATPGRLIDLYNQRAIRFDQLQHLVLDEADRMLDMGFIHDIKRIMKVLPAKRQNLLFSATFSPEVRQLAKGIINNPLEVSVTPENSTVDKIDQCLYPAAKAKRPQLLKHLIKEHSWRQVLVFTRTKHGANRLVRDLELGQISAAAIHGNKSQNARIKALNDFKNGQVKVLVATDIVARGLDIEQLPQVVNFDLPNVPQDYVHRIGRTGRAGASGQAVSFVTPEDMDELFAIERLIQQPIPREHLAQFAPDTELPASRTSWPAGAPKPKKPKKDRGHPSPARAY